MKISVILTSVFLSWVAFDHNLHRRYDSSHGETASLYDEELKKQKIRKLQRKNADVIPVKFRRRKVKLRAKCSYKSVKSKDHRDSDQRKLRRKFNNM